MGVEAPLQGDAAAGNQVTHKNSLIPADCGIDQQWRLGLFSAFY